MPDLMHGGHAKVERPIRQGSGGIRQARMVQDDAVDLRRLREVPGKGGEAENPVGGLAGKNIEAVRGVLAERGLHLVHGIGLDIDAKPCGIVVQFHVDGFELEPGRRVDLVERGDLRLELTIRKLAAFALMYDVPTDRNRRRAAETHAMRAQRVDDAVGLDFRRRGGRRCGAEPLRCGERILGEQRIDFGGGGGQAGARGGHEEFTPIHD